MNSPKIYPSLTHTHCLCTKCARDIVRRNYHSFKDQERRQGESMEQAPLPQCYCSGDAPHRRSCRTCAQYASASRTPEQAKLQPFGCEFFILRQDEDEEE